MPVCGGNKTKRQHQPGALEAAATIQGKGYSMTLKKKSGMGMHAFASEQCKKIIIYNLTTEKDEEKSETVNTLRTRRMGTQKRRAGATADSSEHHF